MSNKEEPELSEEHYNPMPKKYQVPLYFKLINLIFFCLCLISYGGFLIYKKNIQNKFIKDQTNTHINLSKLTVFDTVNNTEINLSHYKKDRFMLLNIWASWCAACIHEMPSVIKLSNALSDKLLVVALSVDDEQEVLKTFTNNQENLKILWDKNKISPLLFNIKKYPETFLLSPDNKIIKQFSGAIDWQDEKILYDLTKNF